MSDFEAHECRYCKELMKEGAKKCPHCQQWAKWYQNPQTMQVFMGFLVIPLMFLFMFLFFRQILPKHEFVDYPDSLSVTSSSFSYIQTDKGPFITTVGTVKNTSGVPWADLVIEVRYYDVQKRLIDVVSEKHYYIVVLPHSESAFRVRGAASRKSEEYASAVVVIKWANEARSFP